MDHLQTSEERKDRWYARHIAPIYVATKPAETWNDLWDETGPSYGANNSNVRSLPFEWIGSADTPEDDDNLSLSQRIQKSLQYHGFLVVSGVLSDRECEQSLEEAWDWMEAASEAERFFPVNKEKITIPPNVSQQSPVHRSDPSTLESIYFPRSVEGGMLPFYGSGHSQFAWTIRSHANVRRVFEALHGTDNLVSSLDGIVLWRGGNNFRTDTGWFHLDQNPHYKPNQECIQGLVNLLPSSSQTGGNVVIAQSHKFFPHHYASSDQNHHESSEFYRQRLDELGSEDWMEVDKDDNAILDPSKIVSCLLQPGDMMLWDSRTVHCSYPAKEIADSPATGTKNMGLIRAATAVAMMPAEGIPDDIIQARKDAVEQSRTLTHWANKVAPLGEEHPEHVLQEKACVDFMKTQHGKEGASKVLLGFDDLTESQQRLVVGKS